MKGQSSIEMFTTVGIVVAFLVPLAFLLLTISTNNFEEVSKMQADVTVKKIANEINTLYLSGPGAVKTITLNLPGNSKLLKIENAEVILILETSAGDFESSYPILTNNVYNLTGAEFETTNQGLFNLRIENNPNLGVIVNVV